jgi:predicted TIM-barrel fold metal-dependent hydrolase
MPAQYMFKDVPVTGKVDDFLAWTVAQMDRFNIEKALVGYNEDELSARARKEFPDRFFFDLPCNPNNGVDEVRRIKRIHAEVGLKAISVFPSGTLPQISINHKYMFPIYACAVELGLPILLNVGVPGPRIPFETQRVEHLDEVCWFFPELKVVMRHGAEPWEALAVKLMLKYPNLYYSTSAFAPKHYPKAIIDYANTRGADKILYAGYFPMGLSLDRIFGDMPKVPLKDEVWPKFLRGNAVRVFNLGGS